MEYVQKNIHYHNHFFDKVNQHHPETFSSITFFCCSSPHPTWMRTHLKWNVIHLYLSIAFALSGFNLGKDFCPFKVHFNALRHLLENKNILHYLVRVWYRCKVEGLLMTYLMTYSYKYDIAFYHSVLLLCFSAYKLTFGVFFLMDFTFLIAIYCFHPLLASGANI